MLKSHINSNRDGFVFHRLFASGFWPALLLILGLVVGPLLAASATENDDRYFRIYGLIEQGDSLSKGGQTEKAKAKYVEAEKALKDLKQLYPTYNPKLVAARLTYLADKIAVIAKPAVAAEMNEIVGATAATKSTAVDQLQVKLLEVGAEPRQAIRLQVETGKSQKVKFAITDNVSVAMPDLPSGAGTLPPMSRSLTATVTPKEVDAAGQTLFEVIIEDVQDIKTKESTDGVTASASQLLRELKGAVLVGAVSDRYAVTKKIELKNPSGVNAGVREGLGQVAKLFFTRVRVLPEEAIGVGAKWETKVKVKELGMTIDETVLYEVVSVEGAIITLKSFTTQSAANQKISHPMMPAMKIDLIKMSGTSSETITLDITKLLPAQTSFDDRWDMSMAMNAGGKKQTMSIKTESKSTLKTE